MPGKHALLSASGFEYMILCPGKPQYESKFPETTNEAAEEGTAMHTVAESCMLSGKDAEVFLGTEVNGFTMNEDRLEYVQQAMNYVKSVYKPAIHEMYVERKFKTQLIPESGGTSDVTLNEALGMLHIMDYKFGRRYVAPDTPQFKGYGAFGLESIPEGQDYVVTHVIQPRIDNFDSHEFKVAEIWEWVDDVLRPAADLALSTSPPRIPGEKQCLWCRAAHVCPELKAHNRETMKLDFADTLPLEMSDDEIGELMNRFPEMEAWMKTIRAEAFIRAKKGRSPTGWKLVRGKTNRKWQDEDKTLEALLDFLPEDRVITPGKLKSVAQVEKALKAWDKETDTKVDLDLGELWFKPFGYALAHEDDKREAVSTAADDFKDVM